RKISKCSLCKKQFTSPPQLQVLVLFTPGVVCRNPTALLPCHCLLAYIHSSFVFRRNRSRLLFGMRCPVRNGRALSGGTRSFRGVACGVKVLELSTRAVLCSLLTARAWTADKYNQPIVLAWVLLFAPAPHLFS
ncbi:unnamed protein product, partial [Ectocarpus sp. 13 AM-2016]